MPNKGNLVSDDKDVIKDKVSSTSPSKSTSTVKGSQRTDIMERSFIMVKPDGVQRGLIGEIMTRFERKGFKLVSAKLMSATEEILRQHYSHLVSRSFFPDLLEYMTSGPVFAMIWEGKGVVAAGRAMLGPTDPLEAVPGTIRGDFGLESGRNICHGSDAVETAKTEIGLWFPEEEALVEWELANKGWIYERE